MDSVMTLNECHPADWIGAVFCLPSVITAELPEASKCHDIVPDLCGLHRAGYICDSLSEFRLDL